MCAPPCVVDVWMISLCRPDRAELSYQRNKSLLIRARFHSLSLGSERYISLRLQEGIPCYRRGLFVKISAEFFAHRLRRWCFAPPSVTPMMVIEATIAKIREPRSST